MRFPAWVDGHRKTRAQRATARLKYIIITLAAAHTERGSIRALAKRVGLDHSTISTYIRRGAFTVTAASNIIDALRLNGSIPASHLTNPLDIQQQ